MTWEDISEAGPHRTCMVKRLVRAGSISVKLPFSQFSNALRAVKPVNSFLPSCSGVQQHHADSCIWQERSLALQKELCKQRHLLPQYSPASSSSPAQITQGTATLWTWNREATAQQSFLCSTSQSTHMRAFLLPGTTLPLLWGTEHQPQAALVPRKGRGKLVLSALCQAQFPDPLHRRLMLLQAKARGAMDMARITTQEQWETGAV